MTGLDITAGMTARAIMCVRATMRRTATTGQGVTTTDQKPRFGGVFFYGAMWRQA
jgi:hypothetical protein